MSGDDLARNIIRRYQGGKSIDSIIKHLKELTRKPPKESGINLASDETGKPNVRPWNWIGLYLLENNRLDESKKLWEALLQIAHEVAYKDPYNGIPPVGTPWNNLAVVLSRMGKTADSLIAIEQAYRYDLLTGNPYGNARQNYENLFSNLISLITSPKKEIKEKDKNYKLNISKIIPKYIKVAFIIQFIVLWLSSIYIYICGFNNWLFLVPIVVGNLFLIMPYLNIKISTPIGLLETSHPVLPKGIDDYYDYYKNN